MSDVLVLSSMDLTPAFATPKGQDENSFEAQLLQRGFKSVQIEPLSAGSKPGKGSRRGFPSALSVLSVSVETIQETSEIFIFADFNG